MGYSDRIAEFRDGPLTTLLQVGNPGDGSGAMANTWSVFSSRTFKRDIRSPVPAEYTDILGKILATDVVRYSYAHDGRSVPHLGVIAEDSPREILTPDGKGVSLGDYNAFLLAGLKAQQMDLQEKGCEIAELRGKMGLIAEEVQRAFPQWVGRDPKGCQTLTVGGFEALTAEALRELRAEKDRQLHEKDCEIAELNEREGAKDQRINELEARLAAIEALLGRSSSSTKEGGR